MRAPLVLLGLLSSVTGAIVVSCASSDTVGSSNSSGSGGGSTASSGSGTGGGSIFPTSGASGSGSSSSSTSSSSSASSSGSGMTDGGSDGSDGGPDCSMGCMPGYVDLDMNKATGVCGCEYNCAMGCPTNTWDVDSNPLTGVCGCEYKCVQSSPNMDPIDPNYTDDNCDGTDGIAEQCIYVSASQGDDNAGSGHRDAPVKTIAKAIQVAKANAVPSVCLSGEVYNEAVTIVSGISIYGGFDQNDPDFKFRRKAGVVSTVAAPGVVFNVPQIDADTHIEGITIQASALAMAGGSTYGVLLGGGLGKLYVRWNVMTIGAGQDGVPGSAGIPNGQNQATTGADGPDRAVAIIAAATRAAARARRGTDGIRRR